MSALYTVLTGKMFELETYLIPKVVKKCLTQTPATLVKRNQFSISKTASAVYPRAR